MRRIDLIFGCALVLVACGKTASGVAYTEVARSFDELARELASCAGALHACGADAGEAACQEEFLDCRERAGEAAEERLIEAASQCQAHAQTCRAELEADGGVDDCAVGMRECIGEVRGPKGGAAGRSAARPNPNAPTYQCFGQLRECVAGTSGPNQCAAEARECVISAIGEPPTRRPAAPSDGGVSDGGKDAGAGAGRAGAGAAGAGAAGASGARAGAGGAAGERPAPPAAGRGGSMAEPAPSECAVAFEACVTRGEKPMKCERELRKCEQPGM